MKLVLEQRYLFDGAVAATAQHAFGSDAQHHAAPTAGWTGGDAHNGHEASMPAPPAIGEPTVARTGSPDTVLFVDPRVANWQQLVAGAKPGVDVVVLDPNQDGVSQVTRALAGLTDVHNVEFLTDGNPGSITLGGTTLDAAVLGARANEINGWSAHLATDADIVFWGCDVGQGSTGAAFVADVHTLTGATVGASSDATGAAALGGDWTLEVATGPLHRQLNPFTKDTLASYTGVLDTPQPIVALQVADGSSVEGSTLNLGDTVTVTFEVKNAASNATGVNTYLDVFVPQGVQLTGSVTEGGATLSDVTAVTISGGSAINPLTHQSERAPNGITDGTMYVIRLDPSLGGGALTGPVVAHFTLPSDPSRAGTAATIGARAGFADGAVLGSGANIEGDTFSSTATLIQPLDPSIAVVGTSNNTPGLGAIVDTSSSNLVLFDPNGTSSGSAVSITPGEIVRFRVIDQLAAGNNSGVSLQVTLPTGLTYENDGSTTVTLVNTFSGVSTINSLGLTAGQQLTETTVKTGLLDLGIGADTTDPVTNTLVSSAIAATAVSGSGQTVTFNLGTLNNPAASFYAVVEFNAVVGNTVPNGTSLSPTLSTVSGSATTATQTVQMPSFVTAGAPPAAVIGVLNLPMFDASLGTLTQMNLTLSGSIYSTGTLTTSSLPSGSSVAFSTKTALTLAKDPSGPVLPSGTPTIPTNKLTLQEFVPVSSISINTPITFSVSPGDSASDPLTASTTKSVTTNLSGFEAVGGGTVPIDVDGSSTTTITTSGGNFSQNVKTQAEASLSVSYTYTAATVAGNAFLTVQAPTVTLAKTITGISYSGTTATVTYTDTVSNSSGVTAYGLSLTDVGDGNNPSDTITYVSDSGSGVGNVTTAGISSNQLQASISSLATGNSVVFTYTEQVPVADVGTTVSDSKAAQAALTWYDLNPALFNPANNLVTGKEVIAGSSATPATYNATATAPLDLINGTVNQDTGATEFALSALTPLQNETATISYTGQVGTESQLTDSSGNFSMLVPDGLSSVTVSATVGGTLSTAVLDNHPSETGTPSPLPLSSTATETGYGTSNTGSFSFNPVSGSNYKGIVFDFWKAPVVNSTPTALLSIVGGSNNTAGLGTQFDPNGLTTPGVLMTDGEIVRERATLELTAGIANSSAITVTLPTGLTLDPNYATDGSVTVLLVSADGNVTTSLTGTGLQLTDASPNTAKLDLGIGADTTDPVVTALPVSDINVSGSTVTFNLGNLKDTAGSYQAIVEFNAIVDKAATTGTVLNTQMAASVGALLTSTQNDFVNTQVPSVTLTKAITGISYSGTTATVTYVDTIANTSGVAAAYGLTLTDPGDGNTSDTITDLSSHSGTGTGASSSVTGGNFVATLTSLPANGTETFSYTETVPVADVAISVADSKTAQATVTSFALNPALFNPANNLTTGKETLANTTETPPTYTVTATAPFDLVSGNVNQDLSPTEDTGSPLQGLPSQTVSVTFTGQTGTESILTAADGSFAVLVPVGDGAVSIHATASTPNAPASDVLDNHPDTAASLTGTSASTTGFHSNPAVLSFTPDAGTSYTGLAFNFWAASTPSSALSVVGGSNNTAGLGTVVDTASGNTTLFDPNGQTTPGVLMTDGEIVRERATLNLTAGSAGNATMTVTLPSDLALDPNYLTDGSVKVLLVSSDGNVTTSLTGAGLQLTDASPNATKLDLGSGADTTDPVTTALPVGDISYNSTTHVLTLNLGDLAHAGGSYSAVVEFNAIVNSSAPSGEVLNTQMTGSITGASTATVNDYVNTQAPAVTLTKAITGISYSGTTATVTYVDTIANTSGVAAAYGLTLTDPGDGNASDTITDLSSHSGTGTGASSSVTGGNFVATLTSLPANGTETFSYTETVPVADVATSVADSKTAQATVTSFALNPALFNPANNLTTGKETLANTLETPPTYTKSAFAPLALVSGTVNQDTGVTEGGLTPLVPLSGETVSLSYIGQIGTESVTTDSNGDFSMLAPGGVVLSVTPTVGTPLVLDNHPDTTGTPSLPTASTTGFETSNAPVLTFTPASGTSYSEITFDFWAGSTPSSNLSIVGSSNNTAGLGTQFDPNGQTSPGVLMTDGEIVRERATLNLTAGSADAASMTVTLPSNLTLDPNYATDGSVTVLLVSADGNVTTTLTGTGLQLTDASPNAAKLDLGTGADTTDPVVTVLPASDINVSGSTVTFNLGNLNHVSGAYQAIVEFNAIVSPTAPTGTVLNTQMTGSANGTTTLTTNDYVNPQAPTVALTKTITGISYAGTTATVTYVDTVSNSSGVTAYNLSLNDVGDGNNPADTIGYVSDGGSGVGNVTAAGIAGNALQASISSLADGKSVTFTYTEQIPSADVATSVVDSQTAQAQVDWQALTNNTEILVGTKVTATTSDVTAKAPLSVVSGTVNQDTASTFGGGIGTPGDLTALSGQTVALTFAGQSGTETTTTDSLGDFSLLAPTGDAITITVTPTAPTAPVPPAEQMDNTPSTTGTPSLPSASDNHTTPGHPGVGTLTFTPGVSSYSGVTFDFWSAPDTAPVLANGPSAPVTFVSGDSGITLFPSSTVADAELDSSFAHDFSGITLTMQRYDTTGTTATPDANDSFTGSGTSSTGVFLNTTNHEVFLNGTEVGTFTETGGKLSITFLATGVTNTTVDTVWQGIAYSYTGTLTTAVTDVVIGTQIDDANNDPISVGGAPLDPAGPHDQGVGGDLVSNVLTATLTLLPQSTATPVLSVVGSSNNTAGLGTLFDPTGQTSPGVAMTDGEIVRERATLDLTVGQSANTSMTVTLPSNLSFDSVNDGSVTILLVSADGSVTTSLTGAGLQLTDASPNAAKLDLGTGADTSDVVTTALSSSAISTGTNTVTFNLGTLSDTAGSYHVIVEFNAIVSPTAPTGAPADVLNTQMTGTANAVTTATVNDYVNPQAPTVTLAKAITGISYVGTTATVTYVDTVSNNSGVTAYGLTLTDNGDGNIADTQTPGTASGTGTGVSAITSTGGVVSATMTSLANGASETFSYTETIPVANLATTVADSALPETQAKVVWRALTNTTETLVHTDVTATTADLTRNVPLALVSGTVNQDTSSTEGGLNPLVPLPNESVVITFSGGGSETVQTDGGGHFTALIPGVQVSITPTVDPSLVLDNHPETTGTPGLPSASTSGFESSNAPTLTFTPSGGTAYTGVTFDFWKSTQTPPIFSHNVGGPIFLPEQSLIPQLALIGSVDNRFVIEDQQTVIQVPPDIFVDSDPNAELVYDAKLPDGTPLPSWLHFDPNNLTFSGTPPLFSRGRIEITITAKDQYGNTAEASFSILIGQKEEDLSKLLLQSNQQPGTFQPYGFELGFQVSDAAPVPPPRGHQPDNQPIQVADAAAAHLREAVHRAEAWRTAPPVKQAGDFGGFTAALRKAGHIGALSRARALLDGLDKLPQPRSSI